jgi:hypothetical protein
MEVLEEYHHLKVSNFQDIMKDIKTDIFSAILILIIYIIIMKEDINKELGILLKKKELRN